MERPLPPSPEIPEVLHAKGSAKMVGATNPAAFPISRQPR